MSTAETSNFTNVTSVDQFQSLLSKDLERVSLINFWAPWAEPCKKMNEVVYELAKRHTTVLVLQVQAEELADIAESFEIEAVPTFLILRGHTLLDRIKGADAATLNSAVAKHAASRGSYKPQSHTDRSPAAPPSSVVSQPEKQETETPEELDKRLRGLMGQSTVVLFMKGSPDEPRCGFSRKMVNLLRGQNVAFAHFDILTDESVRQGLKKLNDWPTFPQLIVKGELVGGLDIVQEMVDNNEFAAALA